MAIPKRSLGRTGVEVTCFGLGGEGVLRSHGRQKEATILIRAALDAGVSYFESARAYAGSEEYLGGALGPDRRRVFLATKSHARRERGALAHLDESLTLLRTEWIDLWMVHDVRTVDELELLAGPGGALEVFAKAKTRGQVRFVGVSGHQDPAVLARALEIYDFDCVLMPVNPAEEHADSFAQAVLPKAAAKGLGVIAMKTFCRGLGIDALGVGSPARFLRYALSKSGVCVASVGCDDALQLAENVKAVEGSAPLSPLEMDALEQDVYPFAQQMLYYRG